MSTNLETALSASESSTKAASAEEANGRARAYTFLIRQIAAGKALSSEEFARELGMAPEAASDLFSALQASGMEFDQEGNLVGAALTPRPTPHRISLGGKELFAWCALDTLFIPGLLDQVGEVRSPCAATGEEIRLRVGPRGVEACEPVEAAISVVLPGIGCAPGETGPASPT